MTLRGLALAISPAECGVDYLTMTWPEEIRDTALSNTRTVVEWAQYQKGKKGEGNTPKAWAWQGYSGWQCGQLSVGERYDGTILRLSGVLADKWLRDGLPTGHNVSRIDLALTIWGVLDRSAQIALHSHDADYHRKTLQSRPYEVRLIDGFGAGDTLYVGSRTSQQFIRIYDKEKEQSDDKRYKGSIRYECECKEELASTVLARCIAGGYSPSRCLSTLLGLLERRAICPLDCWGIKPTVIPNSAKPESSVESSLRWLELQVAPTIRRLVREGYEPSVLRALGLHRFVDDGY